MSGRPYGDSGDSGARARVRPVGLHLRAMGGGSEGPVLASGVQGGVSVGGDMLWVEGGMLWVDSVMKLPGARAKVALTAPVSFARALKARQLSPMWFPDGRTAGRTKATGTQTEDHIQKINELICRARRLEARLLLLKNSIALHYAALELAIDDDVKTELVRRSTMHLFSLLRQYEREAAALGARV